MNKNKILALALFFGIILSACSQTSSNENITSEASNKKSNESTQVANPAAVNCEENGGYLDIREGVNGEVGMCVFEDGSECEEWAFFRGECMKGKTEKIKKEDVKEVIQETQDFSTASCYEDCVRAEKDTDGVVTEKECQGICDNALIECEKMINDGTTTKDLFELCMDGVLIKTIKEKHPDLDTIFKN